MAETETYPNIWYKGEQGTLMMTDKLFHYRANQSTTSVKCSWQRVEKRQLSPPSSSQHMIKLILVSGKTAVFTVRDRKTMDELRTDMQSRMERAKRTDAGSVEDFRRSERMGDSSRKSTTAREWQDEPTDRRRKGGDDPCGWCCICFCIIICVAILVAVGLIYWFVIRDDQEEILRSVGIGDSGPVDTSKPPDYGKEARYGIRSVNHKWDQDGVTLDYLVSDYIMDSSMNYVVYDGLECRRDSNDITASNKYLFVDFTIPKESGGYDLSNNGQGSRQVLISFTLNKAEITQAPFYYGNGLEKGRLNFCVGLLIDYNQVDYWHREEEVNAVETAIQVDIDLSDFRRIEKVEVKPIIKPKYNRRLRALE